MIYNVTMNGRIYPFLSKSDAIRFSEMWNGILLTPIENI